MAEREDLLRRRKQIETLMPLFRPDRAAALRRELGEIDRALGPKDAPSPGFMKPSDLTASATGVNGVGGLVDEVNAPPGAMRLIRVPFYLYDGDSTQASFVAPQTGPLWVTSGGNNTFSTTNPLVTVRIPNETGVRKVYGLLFRTPVIAWAELRVVGLELSQRSTPFSGVNEGLGVEPVLPTPVFVGPKVAGPNVIGPNPFFDDGDPHGLVNGYQDTTGQFLIQAAKGAVEWDETARYYSSPIPRVFLKNFFVGGGANLFAQAGFIDGSNFWTGLRVYRGLRAYPRLTAPDQCFIEAAVQGAQLASTTFSINLICDVLSDDIVGKGRPGPYTRRNASARRPNIDTGLQE
jgi:hypothetical protein